MRGQGNGNGGHANGDGGSYDQPQDLDGLLSDCGSYWLQLWSANAEEHPDVWGAGAGDDTGDGPQ